MRLELGCSLHQIFSVSKTMLPISSCLLWVGTQLFCTYFKCQWHLFLLPGRFCFEAVAGGTVQWQSICVSWVHSQHTATLMKKTPNVTTWSVYSMSSLTKYMIWGRTEIWNVILLSFHEQAVVVPSAVPVVDGRGVQTLVCIGRLLHLMKAPSESV